MADVAQYPIRARIVVGRADTSGILPSLDDVQQKSELVKRSALGIGTAITTGLVAAGAALAFGVTKAIELGTEFETAQTNITSLFMAMEGLDAAAAAGFGKTVIQQLSEDAARGVGELQNYVDAYQGIFAPARQGGASIDQIRELTKLSLTAGFGLQGQRGLINAPLDIQQALTAGAYDRTTPIVMAALRASGVSGEQFNKADRADQLGMLMEGFQAFQGAAAEMGKTVEAQQATMTDAVKRFYRQATEPIFEGFKRGLTSANESLAENQASVDRLSESLSAASESVGILVERTVSAGSDLLAAIGQAPSWDDSREASTRLAYTLAQTGRDAHDFGVGLGEVLARISSTAADSTTVGLELALRAQETFAKSGMPSFLAVAYAMEAVGLKRNEVAPENDPRLNTFVGPTMDMLGPQLDETKKAMRDAGGRERKIKVELKLARIEWGNDRSFVRALTPVLDEVADRADRLATDSILSPERGT